MGSSNGAPERKEFEFRALDYEGEVESFGIDHPY